MKGFLKRYAQEKKGWSLYKLAKESGIKETTLSFANSKSVHNLSALNIKLISEAVGETPGTVLDELTELEKEMEMETTYWYNEGTDSLLTWKEYKALIEREAKEWYEDLQEEEEELDDSDKTSPETLVQLSFENESDFVLSDSEGNPIKEW
ncbi:hypothetical protein [Listeria monocytogenes]|uniref:hypothetical protein n=1 Tax=Listeria monocytogenes TaxID=1639 RepID=UPI001E4F66F1|nr:hypothetical protein [Listeria monocytogenes]MCD2228843.1 hypothetical protein [Listeria monocytogenes]